jgi:hypothetical protein
MQSSHKNTSMTKHDGIPSKLIAKQCWVIRYMDTPGVKYTIFFQKCHQNIGITQITPQFEPFDNAK